MAPHQQAFHQQSLRRSRARPLPALKYHQLSHLRWEAALLPALEYQAHQTLSRCLLKASFRQTVWFRRLRPLFLHLRAPEPPRQDYLQVRAPPALLQPNLRLGQQFLQLAPPCLRAAHQYPSLHQLRALLLPQLNHHSPKAHRLQLVSRHPSLPQARVARFQAPNPRRRSRALKYLRLNHLQSRAPHLQAVMHLRLSLRRHKAPHLQAVMHLRLNPRRHKAPHLQAVMHLRLSLRRHKAPLLQVLEHRQLRLHQSVRHQLALRKLSPRRLKAQFLRALNPLHPQPALHNLSLRQLRALHPQVLNQSLLVRLNLHRLANPKPALRRLNLQLPKAQLLQALNRLLLLRQPAHSQLALRRLNPHRRRALHLQALNPLHPQPVRPRLVVQQHSRRQALRLPPAQLKLLTTSSITQNRHEPPFLRRVSTERNISSRSMFYSLNLLVACWHYLICNSRIHFLCFNRYT